MADIQLRVNIAIGAPDLAWIGGRFARELVARLPLYGVEAFINQPRLGRDLEYQQIVYGPPERRPAVGLFTHGESRPKQFGPDYDGHITLNPVMRDYLLAAGAADPIVVPQPVDDRFRLGRSLVFGVAGRTYPDGRKGEHLVKEMVDAHYHVIAWGSGWPCEIVSSDLSDLRSFYQSLDYYIDTSSDEGGCVAAYECMALGIPIISHTVGVDRPVIPYERHSWPSLQRVLERLCIPFTYDDFARLHAEYFLRVAQRFQQ